MSEAAARGCVLHVGFNPVCCTAVFGWSAHDTMAAVFVLRHHLMHSSHAVKGHQQYR
jgi:hypothetical protein